MKQKRCASAKGGRPPGRDSRHSGQRQVDRKGLAEAEVRRGRQAKQETGAAPLNSKIAGTRVPRRRLQPDV